MTTHILVIYFIEKSIHSYEDNINKQCSWIITWNFRLYFYETTYWQIMTPRIYTEYIRNNALHNSMLIIQSNPAIGEWLGIFRLLRGSFIPGYDKVILISLLAYIDTICYWCLNLFKISSNGVFSSIIFIILYSTWRLNRFNWKHFVVLSVVKYDKIKTFLLLRGFYDKIHWNDSLFHSIIAGFSLISDSVISGSTLH